MRRILLTIISILPLLSYGQSMKIAPKQIEPGDDGQAIITRNGVNVLDFIKWADVSGKPTDLERTSNKVNSLSPSNLDATHYISGKAIDEWVFIWRGAFSGSALDIDNAYRSGYYILSGTPSGTLPSNYDSSLSSSLQVYNQGIITSNYQYQVLTQTDGTSWWRMANYQSSWSDWQQYASQDWVNSQGFLTSETDPIYTADKPNIIFSGDNNSLLNNDAGYITSSSIPAAQTLSISGHDLSLSGGGGTVTIPDNNTTYTAGTGLSLSGTTFNNTAPDKTVVLNTGTGINVTGSYPNFTITNTAPNQNYTLPTASASTLGGIKVGNNLSISSGVLSADVGTNDLFSGNYNDLTNKPNIPAQVNLTGAGATTVTGTYPNLTISSTDNNTTYTGSTSITLNGTSFRRAALTGDVTAAANSNVTTIANNAVTNAKISSVSWSKVTGAPAFITNETDPVYTADNENIMIRRDDLSSSENLNDVLVSGVYFQLVNNNATTALNYPLAGQGGVLEVFKGSDNRAMQRFTARPTSLTPITFVRRMYANAWSDWVQLANIDDIPTVNNGTLTLNTSGIATGSTTFSANQANNSSVTVNVPGTNLGGSFSLVNSKINVTSSTGTNASIDIPFAFDDAGYMTTTGNEGFNTGGGFSTNITKITTNSSSHLINSNDYTIIVAAENCTLNIPSPLDCTGRIIRIVYQSASPTKVTLGLNQPQSLTGSSIAQMNNAGALLIQSDGTNWIQVNNYSN